MVRVAGGFADREQATAVFLEFGAVFRMDGIALPVDQIGGQERMGELLGKPVQRRFQNFAFYVEEIVGVFKRGVGVVAATVAANKLLVFARIRVFFGAQKQHVLQKMCQAFTICRIVAA